MDQETRDYLDRRLMLLAMKDDIERLRQETNAHLRKWKEDLKADIEGMIQSSHLELGPLREEMTEWMKRFEKGTQSTLDQIRQSVGSFLSRIRELEEAQAFHTKDGMVQLRDQVKKASEDVAALGQTVREGLIGLKEELASMIKFSYSDLEKRFKELEARIKALEKMVLP